MGDWERLVNIIYEILKELIKACIKNSPAKCTSFFFK